MPEVNKSASSLPQFHPRSIVRMVWKQRWLVLVIWLFVSVGAFAVIRRLPNVYRAEAVILVDSQKIPEKFVPSTVQDSVQDSMNSITQQVLSTEHLGGILDKYHLYAGIGNKTREELVDRLRKDIDISVERGISIGRSAAFRIAYEAPDAAVAARVVNDVAGLFVEQNEKTREQRAQGTSEFIENQLRQAKVSLDSQEAQLSRYKVKWAGELPEQEPALLGALSRLQQELQGNQDAASRAEQNKLVLENSLHLAESSLANVTRSLAARNATPKSAAAANPGPVKASAALQAQLYELTQRYYDDHPEVRRVRRELKQALAEEAKADETKSATATSPAPAAVTSAVTDAAALDGELERQKERVATTQTQLQVVEQEIAARATDRERILKSMAEYQARVERLPIHEQQMQALTRDYETSRANYRSLLDKRISAGMASDMEKSQNSERFAIADPALPPETPVKPRRMMMLLVGIIFGLAFGLLLGLSIELKKDVFLGEWELPPNVLVLGRISSSAPEVEYGLGAQS